MKITKYFVLTSAFTIASTANAQAPCGQGIYPYTQDTFFSSKWNCSAEHERAEMWRRFDFDKKDWDGGFGFHSPCNGTALHNTFNALQLLKYANGSWSCDTRDINFLKWAYCWAGNKIDELDAKCLPKNGNRNIFAANFRSWWDDRTELYAKFLYRTTVVRRAATIVHEARHAEFGCSHVDCGDGRSCDSSYFNGCGHRGMGGYGIAVHWLAHYVWYGKPKWKSRATVKNAIFEANKMLQRKFAQKPCFSLSTTGRVIIDNSREYCTGQFKR